jgi:hypothetical protein
VLEFAHVSVYFEGRSGKNRQLDHQIAGGNVEMADVIDSSHFPRFRTGGKSNKRINVLYSYSVFRWMEDSFFCAMILVAVIGKNVEWWQRPLLEPDELKSMVTAIRNIEKAMGNGIKKTITLRAEE